MRTKSLFLGILVSVFGFMCSSISSAYDNWNNLGWQLVVPIGAEDFSLIGLELEQRIELTGVVARLRTENGVEQRMPLGGPNFGVRRALWHLEWFYTQRDCASVLAGPITWTQPLAPVECLRANVGAVENGLDVVLLKTANGAVWGAMHYTSVLTVVARILGPVLGVTAGVLLIMATMFPTGWRSKPAVAAVPSNI